MTTSIIIIFAAIATLVVTGAVFWASSRKDYRGTSLLGMLVPTLAISAGVITVMCIDNKFFEESTAVAMGIFWLIGRFLNIACFIYKNWAVKDCKESSWIQSAIAEDWKENLFHWYIGLLLWPVIILNFYIGWLPLEFILFFIYVCIQSPTDEFSRWWE